MVKFIKKNILLIFYIIILGVYVNTLINMLNFPIRGDESFYVKGLEHLQLRGVMHILLRGGSFLYLMLSFLISLITNNNLLACRLISVFSLFLFLHFLWKLMNVIILKSKYMHIAFFTSILFILQSNVFFMAISDGLMLSLSMASLYYFAKWTQDYNRRFLIQSAILLGLAFWVRSFTLIYFCGIVFYITCDLFCKKFILKRFVNGIIFLVICLSVTIIPHIPSLYVNRKLAFENKAAYSGKNWMHKNYLAGIKRKPLGIFSYDRPKMDEVKQYIKENGEHSLPNNRLEYFSFDKKKFLDQFATNLIIRSVYLLFRRTGILIVSFVLFLLYFKEKKKSEIILIYLATFIVFFLSVVCVRMIEVRWLMMPIFLVNILGARYLIDQKTHQKKFLGIQYMFLSTNFILILFNNYS